MICRPEPTGAAFSLVPPPGRWQRNKGEGLFPRGESKAVERSLSGQQRDHPFSVPASSTCWGELNWMSRRTQLDQGQGILQLRGSVRGQGPANGFAKLIDGGCLRGRWLQRHLEIPETASSGCHPAPVIPTRDTSDGCTKYLKTACALMTICLWMAPLPHRSYRLRRCSFRLPELHSVSCAVAPAARDHSAQWRRFGLNMMMLAGTTRWTRLPFSSGAFEW